MQRLLTGKTINHKPWTQEQILMFMEALSRYRGNWNKIASFVKTRSPREVYAYYQLLLAELPPDMKDMFIEYLNKQDSEVSSERGTEVPNESFFAQRVEPVVNNNYRGLYSLIQGFDEVEAPSIQSEEQSE